MEVYKCLYYTDDLEQIFINETLDLNWLTISDAASS